MSKLTRFIFILFSLAGIAVSVSILSSFCYIPSLTETIRDWQSMYPDIVNTVFAVYLGSAALHFIIYLLTALFIPGKSSRIDMKKPKGTLVFSKQAVESVVRYGFSGDQRINSSRIKVKLSAKPGNTKVYVWLSLNSPADLAEVSEGVQSGIESALKESLGVDVKAINIRVQELKEKAVERRVV